MTSFRFQIVSLLTLAVVGNATAQQRPSLEAAAAKLRAATLTIRVAPPPAPQDDGADAEHAPAAPPRANVTVCSGVSLGRGLVISFVQPAGRARIRITVPGGDQAEAQLRVVDHYSGLSLMETARQDIAAVELAEQPPTVGAWIITAAAWGIERPVVSVGVLSGADRAIRGASFPPLLQCDVRTAETSGGAPIADQQGRLIGIVVATDAPGQRSGWTYAVPVDHVRRLMNAQAPDKVVVLRRRRPVVGMVLGGAAGQIEVQRITPDGPADRAGIAVGDQIVAADGLKIRSVYQAVQPVLKKQPGDTMRFLVRQQDQTREIEVTLGGGGEVAAATGQPPAPLADPRIQVSRTGPHRFDVRAAQSAARDVDMSQPAEPSPSKLTPEARDALIAQLRRELADRKQQAAEHQQLIQSLQDRLEALQQQVDDGQ